MYECDSVSKVFIVDHALAVKMLDMTIGQCYDLAQWHFYGTIEDCIDAMEGVIFFRNTFKD
jgi:hypothetical protein